MRRRVAFVLSCLVVLSASASDVPAAPPQAAFGRWRVVDHKTYELSPRLPADPALWHGRTLEFSEVLARVHNDVCRSPKYVVTSLTDAEFATRFRVEPSQAGLPSGSVWMIQIGCKEQWPPRAVLLGPSPEGRLLAAWDGAFFTLAKE